MNLVAIEIRTFESGELKHLRAGEWVNGGLAGPMLVWDACDGEDAVTNEPEAPVVELLRLVSEKAVAFLHPIEDGRLLASLCEHQGYAWPNVPVLSIQALGRILFPTCRDWSFTGLAAALPRPLDDTFPVADMLSQFFQRTCAFPYVTLQGLSTLSVFSNTLSQWFLDAAEIRFREVGDALPDNTDVIHGLVFTKPRPSLRVIQQQTDREPVNTNQADGTNLSTMSPRDFLGKNGRFAAWIPGFEVRDGQVAMADAVMDALDGDMHLIAEAGTGTGKSLAYLVPAVLHAVRNDTRVVVSTHTIALQDQIAKRDFPLIRGVVDEPVRLSVFKGRTHYVCMRKVQHEAKMVNLMTPEDDAIATMQWLTWLVDSETGNREEIPLIGNRAQIWPRVQSESETCINKRCPFFKPCHYFRARARAHEAHVLVTNHSLIFSDLKADHRVLPKYDKLILDEAHHLEEQATKHLGDETSLLSILGGIGRLIRDGGRHGVIRELLSELVDANSSIAKAKQSLQTMEDVLRDLRIDVDAAFTALAKLVPPNQSEMRLTRDIFHHSSWNEFLQLTNKLSDHIGVLEDAAGYVMDAAELEADPDLAGRMLDACGFLQELFGDLRTLIDSTDVESEAFVTWVETQNKGDIMAVSLHRAPIDVAQILRTSLFDEMDSVVLTSATLSVEGRFDYTLQRYGLQSASEDGRLVTVHVPSPFSLDSQSLLCVPSDIPDLASLTNEEAAVWLSDSLYQLAKASQGRLLALFTSHAMLRATAEACRGPLGNAGLNLWAQGIDGDRTYLLDMFRTQPNSVLFGAQSFWEGIDLPGDQLVTLAIIRLPFAPPTHPVTQARHARLQEIGRNPFTASSLPEAVVRFRQGFGRLIRTTSDRGVVVVFDKRIVTARYGRSFFQSIGVRPVVAREQEIIQRVTEFLSPSLR